MKTPKAAVLLLAHGTPDDPADIPEFMRHITGGRPVTPMVMQEVEHRYRVVGKSPLTAITLRQAECLQAQLGIPVYVGMRNWKPFIAQAVRQMVEKGVEQVLAICLAPQNSSTSVGLYRKALLAEMKPGIAMHFVESWHDHPLLVQAFAEQIGSAWREASAELGAPAPVVFTAHSVPTRTIQAGDPYAKQVQETARLVGETIAGLTPELRHITFQSQGMSGGPWLGPTVESAIMELSRRGRPGVVIAPVGFVSDHVEVLYDVDIGFHEFARQHGMKMWRSRSLNDSPTFIAALARLATTELARASGIISLA
jgi:protoporphyrin/coproporphyrin ferrochelatase